MQQIAPLWLTEAARLVPELEPEINRTVSTPAPSGDTPAGDSPGLQSRFLESLSQVLTILCQSSPPGVLFFDDLHWADNATLDWLTYMARRLAGKSLFLLAAWRDEVTPAEQGLQRLVAETRRAGTGALIALKRLERAAVEELVRSAQPHRDQPVTAVAERIFQEAEGLPFFVTKYLEAFVAAGGQELPDWELPPSARDLLRSRLKQAGETGWQLLTSAAVIGRSFTYDVLRVASGRSELEIVEGLDHLLRLHLIQEQRALPGQTAVAYDFTHDKLRTLVYDETSLTRRRLLHQRTADAYASQIRRRGDAGALAAFHYQQAGLSDQAAEYFEQAGDAARALYANRDAIAHYQNALSCGYAQPAELHEAIGDLHTLLAEYQAALTSYETAAALCAPEHLPWIEHRLGIVDHQRGEWDLAECHFEAAAEALNRDQAPEEKARILADWSRTAYRRLNYLRAQELAQRALALAESSDDCSALSQTHNMLGLLAGSHQDYPRAIQHLQRSLEVASALGDPAGRAAALNNLARVYAEGGDHLQAITLTQEALDLCLHQGDRHRAAALHNNLADLYHATGDAESAMEHLKRAVAAFAEIGLEVGEQKPEIWMLTEW